MEDEFVVMRAMMEDDPEGFVAHGDEVDDRLVVEDNHVPASMRGQSLFLSVQMEVEERDGRIYAETEGYISVPRKDAERLRDWLNNWLVKHEVD